MLLSVVVQIEAAAEAEADEFGGLGSDSSGSDYSDDEEGGPMGGGGMLHHSEARRRVVPGP